MNPYLTAQRAKFDALRSSIEGLQTRAADENRDLTEDELRSVTEQAASAKSLAETIESLTEVENRNAKVASLAARVDSDIQNRTETPGSVRVGGATTQDRDPGHYRSVKDGGSRSFFSDVIKARYHQDQDALGRLTDHNRALNSATDGPGVLPPVWMAAEFVELARQQRRVANAVRNLPLTDPRPMSMPKQATDAGAPVVQSAENATTVWTDSWSSNVDTVNPVTVVGGEELSRQLLDSATPAIDSLIWGNLIAQYNSQIEARVVKAMADSAGAAVVTYADEDDWAAGLIANSLNYVGDAILDTAIAVRSGRKLPANVLISSVNRYGDLLKMKDSTGRPMIPSDSGGAMNVIGTGDVAVDGRVHGLGILATDGVPATYPESLLVARTQDVILFESPTVRFRFDEPKGPETIRLGVWGYVATYVQYAGTSVRRIEVTDDGGS